MTEDWKKLKDAEELAYFKADLVDISPQSYSLEEKKRILDEMVDSSSAIEDALRADFNTLDEVAQTKLLDALAAKGPESREWWRRLLVGGPDPQDLPAL